MRKPLRKRLFFVGELGVLPRLLSRFGFGGPAIFLCAEENHAANQIQRQRLVQRKLYGPFSALVLGQFLGKLLRSARGG